MSLFSIERRAGRASLVQAVGDGRAHGAGLGQGGDQELGRVEIRRQPLLCVVDGQEEAMVVVGLEQVA